MTLSRRALLGSSLGALSAFGARRALGDGLATTNPRCISLDITATHICKSAGVTLVGAASASTFRKGRSDLVLPEEIVDVGLPPEPNLELIESLSPDLIVSAWPAAPDSPLRSLAPFVTLDVLNARTDRYAEVCRSIEQLGQTSGTTRPGLNAIADAEDTIRQLAKQSSFAGTPIYLVNLNQDGVSVLAYGRHSLMDAVLRRLGLENAWSGGDDVWGWVKTGPEALARRPDAMIIHIAQYWQGVGLAMHRLTRGAVWNALPQVRNGRLLSLPPIDIFGGLPTALRFAGLLTDAVKQTQP